MSAADRVRVDKWLWAVRVFKTRTAANEACATGKVRVNGEPAKPATKMEAGDRVRARVHGSVRDLEVVELVEKRVGAPKAAEAYVDHAPPDEPRRGSAQAVDSPVVARRERGTGRPTKRDRREIDRFRRGSKRDG